jgi:amidophosphoribosyltransferase
MYWEDKFHDECGVFGIWGHTEAVKYTTLGLTALQHRGQDSSGIAVSDAGRITRICRSGSTANLISDDDVINLKGKVSIGHVRYSTVGESDLKNAQPLILHCPYGQIALCHNGQIVNFHDLKEELTNLGAEWLTSSDSEIVLQLCRMSKQPTALDAVIEAIGRLEGAFSLLLLTNDALIVARDPYGFRPLCMGRLGHAVIVCSETCALDAVGAEYIKEIEPGEITAIDSTGIRTLRYSLSKERAHCIFEHVYFARPDSYIFGHSVGAVRVKLGHNLARETHIDADVIVPLPESGMWVALGYQEECSLPLRLGLVRNSYLGRTFIEPEVRRRGSNIKLKLNPVRSVLTDKRVVLIDDSIVRGETMARIVEVVRQAGAREVHVRIGSPPTIAPCIYGINTPTKSELIAAEHSVNEVRRLIGADSLRYLSLEGLLDAVGSDRLSYCTACYTGDYRVCPPKLPRLISQPQSGIEKSTSFVSKYVHVRESGKS